VKIVLIFPALRIALTAESSILGQQYSNMGASQVFRGKKDLMKILLKIT
jgi:hypothetical protein